MLYRFLLVSALMLTGASPVIAQTVYSNNFDTPAVALPGVVATFSGGASIAADPVYVPTYGNIWRDDGNSFATGITLTLSNLPAHVAVKISFVMAFLNSWDSRDGTQAPDNLDVWVDGAQTGSYTYNNASGTIKDIGGGTLIAQYVQFETDSYYSDSVVNMATDPAYTFAHSASTLTVNWLASGSGWQFLGDEGYGIDNLVVTLTPVPEPTSWALFSLGLAGLAACAARRR